MPSFRTTREPIQYPVAQRTKIRLRLDQELLIRVVGAADHEAARARAVPVVLGEDHALRVVGGDLLQRPADPPRRPRGTGGGEKGGGQTWLENDKGVVLKLRTKRQGLMLAGGADAIKISFRR